MDEKASYKICVDVIHSSVFYPSSRQRRPIPGIRYAI